jgi:uncharacterized membrane protein
MPLLIKYQSRTIGFILIFIGVLLRAIQFFYNRSFWGDEAMLALKLLHEPIRDLIVFSSGQAAPPLFMLLIRAMIGVFGSDDMIFRLIPFFCGILSIPLFYAVALRFLPRNFALFSLGLFSLLDNLIYYSSELKQYNSDVFSSILLLFIYVKYKEKSSTALYVILVISALVLIWFSHPIIFVCASIIIMELFTAIAQKKPCIRAWILSITIGLSFCIQYFLTTIYMNRSVGLNAYWKHAFWPLIPHSILDILWLPINLLRLGSYFLGLRLTLISKQINQILSLPVYEQMMFLFNNGAIFLYIIFFSLFISILIGVGIYRYAKDSKTQFFLLILPLVLTLVASVLKKYPFEGRFLLYYFPYLTILVSGGLLFINEGIKKSGCSLKTSKALVVIIGAIILFHPFSSSLYHIRYPRSLDYSKEIIRYLQKNDPKELMVVTGINTMVTYYSAQLNQAVLGIPVPSKNELLSEENKQAIINSGGVLCLSFRDQAYHDTVLNYINTTYKIEKIIRFSNLASIIYLSF